MAEAPAIPAPEFVLRLRDRLAASPAFRRWAGAFWPTRFLARRRARQLFDLAAGFVYAQVLRACVELDLFRVLAAGPLPLPELARRLGLSEEAAGRLAEAATAVGLLQRRRGGYGLGPLGGPMVGNGAVAAMVRHHALFYADLADPVALITGPPGQGALARFWGYADPARRAGLTPEEAAAYSDLMAASQPLVAEEVLAAYDFSRHRVLLDVGGGLAAFLIAAARRHPGLALWLFDLPAVTALAEARLAAAGLSARARVFSGDFHADPLPQGADVITLIRVVHDHDDEAAQALLLRVRQALKPGGALLICEPMAGTPGAEAMGAAYFNLYLHAMGSGRARRPEELAAMLRRAGFGRVRLLPTATPVQTRVLHAVAGS
ncbi:MAG: methyltransferase [Rhodovarius sp.]|nr:acetylserotonin O-methyltransferase [Rhodovarius sp.]MCX7931904.1 acetylserotonin O-methyltransferase [Rhodovarius sp.]MDW8314919.1 methyltransferase [Rhodovarius sp.]